MPFCTQFDLVTNFRLFFVTISAFLGSKYLALYIYKNNMVLYSFSFVILHLLNAQISKHVVFFLK